MIGGTLFTGGGGADLGLQAAGVEVVLGIEYDAEIAAVARNNGLPVEVGDILDLNPHALPYLDFIHASPPCPNFSVAKAGRSETAHDLALARKVADIVLLTSPAVFTLENVPAYRDSRSFQHIVNRLARRGYFVDWQIVNAADFGVPQTRRRLWLRAARAGLLPPLPPPVAWVGWYAAIEDLLPTLPESAFAPWQLARLPEKVKSGLYGAGGFDNSVVYADRAMPSFTITANQNQAQLRAFIVDDQGNGTPGPNRGLTIRDAASPVFTISTTQTKRSLRAQLAGGRVVAMTPRCMARFQSFPDWYKLPERNALACRAIGNAVPPLLMQQIAAGLVGD